SKQFLFADTIHLKELKDTSLCEEASFWIRGNSKGTANAFIWSSDSIISDTINEALTDSSFYYTSVMDTTFYLNAFNEGCKVQDSIHIDHKNTEFSLNKFPDNACTSDTFQLSIDTFNIIKFKWQFNNGNIDTTNTNVNLSYDTAGDYNIKVIGTNKCNRKDTLVDSVSIFPDVKVEPPSDTLLCELTDIRLPANSFGTASSFTWSQTNSFSDQLNIRKNDSVIQTSPIQNTTYFIRAANKGCSSIDSVQVRIGHTEIEVPKDTIACKEENISFDLSPIPDSLEVKYDWDPDSIFIPHDSSSSVTVSADSNIKLFLSTTNQFGCKTKDSINYFSSKLDSSITNIEVDEDSILKSDSTQLYITPTDYNISWEPSNSLSNSSYHSPIATPDTTTTYQAELSDRDKCFVNKDTTIFVHDPICGPPDIYIPNAFSPNGDGENDILYVRGNNIKKLLFRVYNRWGEKVFESKDQESGWDGFYKNRKADPAVYVYYLEVTCTGDKTYFKKGNVTLIR
ncbi:MAG: gliding motility-associated C-terminal domain-containing protein, partial [Flavobacteriales bacterium]